MANKPTTTNTSWIRARTAQTPNLKLLAGFGTFRKEKVIYKTIKTEAITTA